jgi:hypothetical protein
MQVLNSRGNLVEVELGLGLVELGLLDDLVKELPTLRQLQHCAQKKNIRTTFPCQRGSTMILLTDMISV